MCHCNGKKGKTDIGPPLNKIVKEQIRVEICFSEEVLLYVFLER